MAYNGRVTRLLDWQVRRGQASMLTFLFWNMGGRTDDDDLPRRARGRNERLASILANLTHRHAVDLLILAECPLLQKEVMQTINAGSDEPFRDPDPKSLCPRITIYPRFPGMFISLRQESGKYTCRAVELPGRTAFTLWAVHFGSKLFKDEDSQSQAMPGFSAIISALEQQHDRTLLVGDLNMNPFETGMVKRGRVECGHEPRSCERRSSGGCGGKVPVLLQPDVESLRRLDARVAPAG